MKRSLVRCAVLAIGAGRAMRERPTRTTTATSTSPAGPGRAGTARPGRARCTRIPAISATATTTKTSSSSSSGLGGGDTDVDTDFDNETGMDTAGQACGDCGVTDDCIEASCLELGTFSTDQCPVGEGPGEDGDYLDPALTESTIASMPWSSSPVGDAASGDAWVMWFDGEIGVYPQAVNDLDLVRCVRAEP